MAQGLGPIFFFFFLYLVGIYIYVQDTKRIIGQSLCGLWRSNSELFEIMGEKKENWFCE